MAEIVHATQHDKPPENAGGTVTQTTSTGYDPDGNVTSQTNGNSNQTTYAYNALGQQTSTTNPLNKTTSYTYDPDGNLKTETTPDAATMTESYNADDELTGTSFSTGTPSAISYSYDADARMIAMTDATGTSSWVYNSLGELTSHTNGAGSDVQYGYDLAGNVTSITYPASASDVVDYAYNAAAEMTSEKDWLGNTNTFAYDPDGNLTKTTLADATFDASTYNGDDDQLSTSTSPTANPGQKLASVSYTYNNDNEVASETDTSEPEPTAVTNNAMFAYDQAGDLTTINGNSGYVYNAAGELTSAPAAADPSQTSPAAMTYAYNGQGERTSETPAGQTADSLAYNQAGELTSETNGSSTLASFTYDGTGLRATETAGGATCKFAYDTVADTPLILTDQQNSYIYGPSATPIEQISTNGTELYLHHDALGSVRSMTNQAGTLSAAKPTTPTAHSPQQARDQPPSRFGYAGAYTDPVTGLIYLDHRYYDPNTGQFLSVDPLVEHTKQPYEYTAGNPINQTDPTGLESEGDQSVRSNRLSTEPERIRDDALKVESGGVRVIVNESQPFRSTAYYPG